MLSLKLKEVLAQQGKLQPYRWLTRLCGFSKAKAVNLINLKQKSIAFADLSTLCVNLHCTPNDLLYWDETKSRKLPPTHPIMTQLTPPPDIEGWKQLFKHMTEEQIKELYNQGLSVIKGEDKQS